ncbi:hypothetical protein GCM10028818_42360 [Spirosoma horti]
MNHYTLDFTDPDPVPRPSRSNRWTRQRMYRTCRQIPWLLCGLVCSLALIGLFRQRSQTQRLCERYQAQTIQYDSLLAAKVEADRQLDQMRIRLLNYHHP